MLAQRFVLERLLRTRGLQDVLRVEPNILGPNVGMWHLTTDRPVPKLRVIAVSDIWGTKASGIGGLAAIAAETDVEWLAVMLSPADSRGLLELSAIAWLDPRVVAVSGLITEADNTTIRWSGGMFLPGGGVMDPYRGQSFATTSYHGQLHCQRCVDVPSPINLLIRADSVIKAAAQLPSDASPDAVVTMLGLVAHEENRLVAATPLVRDKLPPQFSFSLPSAAQHKAFARALENGSRWYDGRLSADVPYTVSERFNRGLAD
jgi:hypothetical protein